MPASLRLTIVIGWKTVTLPTIWLVTGVRSSAHLFSVISRCHNVGADGALVAPGSDRRDPEDMIVDVLVRHHELGHVTDVQLVFPVRRPRRAPENPIPDRVRRRRPAQV